MKNLRPYDYKVFVTGPHQAGKTKLIHVLDPAAISVERPLLSPEGAEPITTTTGFDLGRVMWVRSDDAQRGRIVPLSEYDEESEGAATAKLVEFRGVPGMLHYKFVRDTMRSGTNLVLLVVDSCNRDMIKDAITHLEEVHTSFGSSVNVVVIANKQDRENAADPEEVAQWLGVEQAIGMTTKDPEDCREKIVTILYEMLG